MDKITRAHARNMAVLFGLPLGLWLLMSGHYDVFHISMGILSSAIVVLLNARLNKHYFLIENAGGYTPIRLGRVFLYIPWLIWQIVLASLQVARIVLDPRRPVDPSLVKFKTRYPNALAQVFLANSITLTPGTITLELNDGEYIVHALTDASASGIVDDSMPRKVAGLFAKTPGPVISETQVIRSAAELG
jgi:multicomponent Na+:H+ antiporter subunit E